MQNAKLQFRILKIFLLLLFNFYFLIFTFSQVQAQSVALGVYPPILQVMIQPGKTLTQVYKIYNSGDPVIIDSRLSAFTPKNEAGNVEVVDCKAIAVIGCESIQWFSFQNANLELGKSFFLKSDTTQEIVLKISVPDYAAEGDYYNTLLFTNKTQISEGNNTQAQATIGSNILLTVSKDGNPNRKIEINQFSVKKKLLPLFDSFDLVPVTLKVSNTGNAYTSVSGKIRLIGFPGLTSLFTIPSQNILAETSRILVATPSASTYSLDGSDQSFTLPKGFYFGKYNIEAEVENQEGQIVKGKTTFFAVPFKLVFALVLVILLFSMLLFLYRKVNK